MADHWEAIRHRSLLELTLPGSHNPGNTPGLGAERLCHSDYRYEEFVASTPTGQVPMSRADFDARFLPWNINHGQGISAQLKAGARWFHLKLCSFLEPGSAAADLGQVFHQHRGYTSPRSLADFLDGATSFLASHPQEVVVLSFTNLQDNRSATFAPAAAASLARAVVARLVASGLRLAGREALDAPLEALVASQRRVAVFFGGSIPEADLPEGVLPTADFLTERWAPEMQSGDLAASARWLLQELAEHATQRRGRFYVLQANPNDSEERMYARLRSGEPPTSLAAFLRSFLESLGPLVLGAVAQDPRIRINAISTDFLNVSRPYDIAMRLMGLPMKPEAKVPSQTSKECLNPVVASGHFADGSVDDARHKPVAAYVLQRHTDRWLYRHDILANSCWPGQLNSSAASSALAAKECDLGGRRASTTWEQWPEEPDPYASPARGRCQVYGTVPQALQLGREHARRLGEVLRSRYVGAGLVDPACPRGQVALHADHVQKNELTLETEYQALCGRPPDLREFPREATLVNSDAKPAKGTPWYLATGRCGGERFEALARAANASLLKSHWWNVEVQAVAAEVAKAAGHPAPQRERAAEFVDSLIDCVTVHACTGLVDAPPAFLDAATGLPGTGRDALYGRMDRLETATRTWPLQFWRRADPASLLEFGSLYYGYFLAVVTDKLRAAAAGDARAPKLSIAVMSDSNISPLLAIYNLSEAALRPPYLSTLVHEVLRDSLTGSLALRVLYNGQPQRVCGSPGSFPLCPLAEWEAVVAQWTPSPRACPVLYSNYDFLAPPPREVARRPSAGEEPPGPLLSGRVLALGVLLALCCLCRSRRRDAASAADPSALRARELETGLKRVV